jgi:hypothetical protein
VRSMWEDGISDREYYAQFGSYEEPEDDGCPQCGASSGQACEEECGRDIRIVPTELKMTEPDLSCPKCGNTMDLLSEGIILLRVCPVCATLAWNAPNGAVEIREPEVSDGDRRCGDWPIQ